MKTSRMNARRKILSATCLLAGLAVFVPLGTAHADRGDDAETGPVAVVLPLIVGWYNGLPAPYISTEASDPAVAKQMNANYVERLGAAAGTDAVDDIYTITNFKQNNIIPSRPKPAGPRNKDLSYTPLWQVSTVTWNEGTSPVLLKSEAAVMQAASSGLVTLNKTKIVVNCPVVFTPSGGLLPGATLLDKWPE